MFITLHLDNEQGGVKSECRKYIAMVEIKGRHAYYKIVVGSGMTRRVRRGVLYLETCSLSCVFHGPDVT